MTAGRLHVVVPGSLEERTGGTIYDRRMVLGLRELGWDVAVHELESEAEGDQGGDRASPAGILAHIEDGACVVIDGLVMRGLPDVIREQRDRLRLVALVHLLAVDDPELDGAARVEAGEREDRALDACVGVITSSPFNARRLEARGLDPGHIRVAPPGVDRAAPATGPAAGQPPRLLCVASITPGKGQDVLVRALAHLVDVPWSCVCAGSLTRSPSFVDRVIQDARAAGLAERVELTGELGAEAIDRLYDTSSIFVLPSVFETYGMVLTEAMARGLPIVSTTAGAIPETVPQTAGVFVAPGDAAALAGALRSLLQDDPGDSPSAAVRRARLGAAGRGHVAELPDWERSADSFADAVAALGDIA